MSTRALPGERGNPLPADEIVIRLARESKYLRETGRANPGHFELSSEDEASALKSILVWAQSFTTYEQARDLMGDRRDMYNFALLINVREFRSIRADTSLECVGTPPLDVVWDPLDVADTGLVATTTEPGADGHAGITNLSRLPGMPRICYKSLRSQLADVATVLPIPGKL